MTNQSSATTVCGLPHRIVFPTNDTTSFINDVLVASVNAPLSVFAFVSNLLVILTVVKTPSLQRPANVLLCSLAATDCLTGVTTQPVFIIWRLMIHRARRSCYLQTELYQAGQVLSTLNLGCSFAILTLISFDRARALSNPMRYRTEVTNKDAKKAAFITTTAWLLVTILLHAFLPRTFRFILQMIFTVSFILLPAINHFRIFIAIRRHNRQIVGQIGAQQLSVIFRREKKVAADMAIVVLVLAACLGPVLLINMTLQLGFPEIYARVFYPWAFTMIHLNSSINPFLYLTRNEELRNALRSVVRSCCSCF